MNQKIRPDIKELSGVVDKIIFSAATGFTVFSLELDAKYREVQGCSFSVAVTGYYNNLNEHDNVKVFGEFEDTKKYGRQFRASYIQRTMPHTASGVIRYLQSAFYGIGPVTAKKIVMQYGIELEKVFEDKNAVENLISIGIGRKRAQKICDQYLANSLTMEEHLFYADLGLTDALIGKIKQRFGARAQEEVKCNPYQLIDEIDGIGFQRADNIARRLGISSDDPNRLQFGILYTMDQESYAGHVYLLEEECIAKSANILSVSSQLIQEQLPILYSSHKLVLDENRVYLARFYRMEVYAANKLVEISQQNNLTPTPKMLASIQKSIKKIEKKRHAELDDSQRQAVIEAVTNGVFVLTGGPGTGKTTTLDIIISYLREQLGEHVVLCAPTGRAAKRMSEQTGMSASTIHRLIGAVGWTEDGYDEDEDYIEADTIIIDEMSMVDITLLYMLLTYVKPSTRLIMVGDSDQLPSIGPGRVLVDLIRSGAFPVGTLTKIYRQEEGSLVIENAHKINHGIVPDLTKENPEFVFVRKNENDTAMRSILQLVTVSLPSYYHIKPTDVQVLSPRRRGDLGVLNLNKVLQETINPKEEGKPEIVTNAGIFRLGDKVIHTKNNYELEWHYGDQKGKGVMNGEIGFVVGVNARAGEIEVQFTDERIAEYDVDDMNDLALAYALTVHKSQGAEYPVVVFPCVEGVVPMLCTRNLLYTAVTRAQKSVVMIGKQENIKAMIDNTHCAVRNTFLAERLKRAQATDASEEVEPA